jgi:DNA-binding NtrC family response regulator
VRQLANTVEAGLIRAAGSGATRIERHHLFGGAPSRGGLSESFHEATRTFQRAFLARALEEDDWNVTACARRLDLSRSRLNELIRALSLTRPGA